MAFKHLTNETRQSIINLVFNKGRSIKEAASILDVNYKTAARVCRLFTLEDRIDKKRPVKAKKFGIELENHVRTFFESVNKLGTLADCRKFLIENHSLAPSLSTIFNVMKRIRLTLKDIVVVPAERNNETAIKGRKMYVSRFMRLEAANVNFVFIDEFGCNLAQRRRRGYSLIGTPCHVTIPGRRGDNLSVCAAIDINGPIHYKAKFRAFDQFYFKTFLEELKSKLDANAKNVLIMDNARFHKTEVITGYLKSVNLALLYLPIYSPMLNPIEECFSKVKNEIRRQLVEGRDLFGSVDKAFEAVTSDNCRAWFNHCKQFFPQCINEQPITSVPEELPIDSDDEDDESAEFDEMLLSIEQ